MIDFLGLVLHLTIVQLSSVCLTRHPCLERHGDCRDQQLWLPMAGVSGDADTDGVDARAIRSLLRAGVHV